MFLYSHCHFINTNPNYTQSCIDYVHIIHGQAIKILIEQDYVEFLGHSVSAYGISSLPKNVTAATNVTFLHSSK